MWIHENHCRPVPMTEPAKSRTGRASAGSAPPSPPSTTPRRSSRDFHAVRRRARRRLLPAPAQLGLKTRAGRRLLVHGLVAVARAVIADCRGVDPGRRFHGEALDELEQRVRHAESALQQEPASPRRPETAGDRLAGEIHDRVDARLGGKRGHVRHDAWHAGRTSPRPSRHCARGLSRGRLVRRVDRRACGR